MKIQTRFGEAAILIRQYQNGAMAVQLFSTEDGSPIATLSVNFPGLHSHLKKWEFFAKTWSENEGIAEDCLKSGLFEDTGRRYSTGFVNAQVWRFIDGLKNEDK